jgi:pimeloyl-ACP methyl ester carboxylesterase
MSQDVQHSKQQKVKANGIEIVYDTFGDQSASPMLLVAGLGVQLIGWDEEFCELLASQGYWVIRFDNRDVGCSTRFDKLGMPDMAAFMQVAMQQTQMGSESLSTPYYLRDMANDAVSLLDTLGIESAHILGASMGGMIVQETVIHHPDRIRTMTSISSSTGNPALPPPTPEAMAVLMQPPPMDRESHIENSLASARIFNGPTFPIDEDRVRERARQNFDRGLSPAGTARQLAAIFASGSRKEALKSVTVPTLVIHGDADPLVPVEGGIDTAEAIPDAELLIIEGMGHDFPPAVWPLILEAVVKHAV